MSSRRHTRATVAPRVDGLCPRTLSRRHQDGAAGASGEHRLHRRRMTAVMGNRGAQVRNATLGRSPLVKTLFLIWHVHCQSPPALALECGEASRFCACCSTTATSGWPGRLGGMHHRGSCSRDGVQPTGILAGNERVWHTRALPFAGRCSVSGSINLLPGGLGGPSRHAQQ